MFRPGPATAMRQALTTPNAVDGLGVVLIEHITGACARPAGRGRHNGPDCGRTNKWPSDFKARAAQPITLLTSGSWYG